MCCAAIFHLQMCDRWKEKQWLCCAVRDIFQAWFMSPCFLKGHFGQHHWNISKYVIWKNVVCSSTTVPNTYSKPMPRHTGVLVAKHLIIFHLACIYFHLSPKCVCFMFLYSASEFYVGVQYSRCHCRHLTMAAAVAAALWLACCCCAALILACRCAGGWKYLHLSREHRPLT